MAQSDTISQNDYVGTHPGTKLAAVTGFVVVTLISVALNARIGVTTDVSWLITIIERMMAGERLYVDVIETNPPFSMWLYYPAVAAAKILDIAPELAVSVFAYLTCAAGLGLTIYISERGKLLNEAIRWWFWPAVLGILLILPGDSFAQREHFGMMLFLPLLALMAWRSQQRGANQVPVWIALVTGVAASIMILVKPHWALAVLLPAIFIARSKRSLAELFRIEFVAIGVIATGYLASVLVIHPEFLEKMYPILKQLYLPIRNASEDWFWIFVMFALVMSVWLWARMRSQLPALADISAISALGFFAAMFFLGKGWNYHLYPSAAAALFASVIALEHMIRRGVADRIVRIGCASLLIVSFTKTTITYHSTIRPSTELVAVVRAGMVKPRVASIGADIALGFPFTRLVDGKWLSTYNSDWAGGYAHLRLKNEKEDLSGEDRSWLESFVTNFIAFKTNEFLEDRPDVIVSKTSGPWIDRIYSDPGFSNVMGSYEIMAQNPDVTVWRRKSITMSSRIPPH